MSEMKEFLLTVIQDAEDDRVARIGYIDGILSNLNLTDDTYHTLLKYIVEYGDVVYEIGVLDQAMRENTVNDLLAGKDYRTEKDYD